MSVWCSRSRARECFISRDGRGRKIANCLTMMREMKMGESERCTMQDIVSPRKVHWIACVLSPLHLSASWASQMLGCCLEKGLREMRPFAFGGARIVMLRSFVPWKCSRKDRQFVCALSWAWVRFRDNFQRVQFGAEITSFPKIKYQEMIKSVSISPRWQLVDHVASGCALNFGLIQKCITINHRSPRRADEWVVIEW